MERTEINELKNKNSIKTDQKIGFSARKMGSKLRIIWSDLEFCFNGYFKWFNVSKELLFKDLLLFNVSHNEGLNNRIAFCVWNTITKNDFNSEQNKSRLLIW